MGCTSSAPNMPEITANMSETEENDISNVTGDVKEDKDAIRDAVESDTKDATASNVLPTCDSLEENIQLARNSDSFTKTRNEEQEQDNQLTSVVENEDIKISEDESEQKFTTLKEVADHVILNNILEDIDQTSTQHINHELSNNEAENVPLVTEDTSPELLDECNDEQLEETEGQENSEEATSPSQSDGNRSTRWEALADIAAELPPSLAVDPMTGQIYSLTK
ncbi:uncharacterized protein [Maniola hyperantus]|uniref:uncharacterized protein n=1 Tax=Aphantopus hyperantus TaxID=2795564 RepID=UPI001568FB9A|nr:uncharacterized protein LOC117988395 [Maniola hyperantus]